MPERRTGRVWASINARASADDAHPVLWHVCFVCAELLAADGAAVSVTSGPGTLEPLFTTDAPSEELEEIQYTLGQGPSYDACTTDGPVLVPDLAASSAAARWPMFAPAAVARGIRAMFAFPVTVGAARVGVLRVHRRTPGALSAGELADALTCADAVLELALDDRAGVAVYDTAYPGYIELTDRRMEVHQAAGMVSVQLDIHVTDALARLRAYAYVHDRRLMDVAADVVARRLRFAPDEADGSGLTSDGDTDPELRT